MPRSPGERVPLTVWAVTALHVGLLLTFTFLYPPFTGFDETQHVDAVLSIRHGDGWPAPQERQLSEGIVAVATPAAAVGQRPAVQRRRAAAARRAAVGRGARRRARQRRAAAAQPDHPAPAAVLRAAGRRAGGAARVGRLAVRPHGGRPAPRERRAHGAPPAARVGHRAGPARTAARGLGGRAAHGDRPPAAAGRVEREQRRRLHPRLRDGAAPAGPGRRAATCAAAPSCSPASRSASPCSPRASRWCCRSRSAWRSSSAGGAARTARPGRG